MPIFKRPDAEIHYEIHGTGYPLRLLAPRGLRSELAFWPANLEVQKDWRGPTHLAESIRRVTDFLTRHTSAS